METTRGEWHECSAYLRQRIEKVVEGQSSGKNTKSHSDYSWNESRRVPDSAGFILSRETTFQESNPKTTWLEIMDLSWLLPELVEESK